MPGRLPIYQLVCRAPHPNPHRAARGEIHGERIGGSSVPMRFTERLIEDVVATTAGGRIRFAPFCRVCGVATEYEACTEEEADAA